MNIFLRFWNCVYRYVFRPNEEKLNFSIPIAATVKHNSCNGIAICFFIVFFIPKAADRKLSGLKRSLCS